ncbi:UDP-N-acetylglucosamine 1-carboxyvinyltransferase [Kitasatospora sp. NPDC096147]|uniref:UDP-N-acetylglucosamine 1-carboxyvinyltransferase n=1 Tax=Kitasatospora sp. NPDC096147 TaxID=3364093 RepID=UPI00381E12F4
MSGTEPSVRITGGRPLRGTVTVQGGKNIALHLYAVGALADEPLTLTGAPEILDTGVCAEILRRTGARTTVRAGEFTVRPAGHPHPVIPAGPGRRIRTTAVLGAALLARAGWVGFPMPGGDAFCVRLIDRHLAAMTAAGCEVEVARGRVRARFGPGRRRPFAVDAATRRWGPSLGATVTAMLLAARAPGTSVIRNPSREPEVICAAALLEQSGVGVEWGDGELRVTGTGYVRGGVFAVPPDRLEAATLALAAAVTGGSVRLAGFPVSAFPAGLVAVFAAAGIHLSDGDGDDTVGGDAAGAGGGTEVRAPAGLRAVRLATGPHPGFPTDVQPQLTAALARAEGTSRIEERIYRRRDSHLPALIAFGASVGAAGPVITVRGPSRLTAADVVGQDIRAVSALVIAALAAHGTSTVRGLYHLRRGHGHLLPKLASLGAELTIEGDVT